LLFLVLFLVVLLLVLLLALLLLLVPQVVCVCLPTAAAGSGGPEEPLGH
jgi:hypothetical protein